MKHSADAYCIKDYGRRSTFASFLPGIAGIKGIPIWCYYVNRGQGVVSFGVENKDHAIMEFYPAHQAYQRVKQKGFRTFIRRDGRFYEPFREEKWEQEMTIHMNALELTEENREAGLRTEVCYYILPEERVGALVRILTVTNTGRDSCRMEVLDGMPELIPYGVDDGGMKNMTQTSKAWMQVEQEGMGVPYYRVRASMEDSASVQEVKGGCFSMAVDDRGQALPVIVDPEALFAYDTALDVPVVFFEGGLRAVYGEKQARSNLLPCSFFGMERELKAGEAVTVYELIGQVEERPLLDAFLQQKPRAEWFEEKKERAGELIAQLCSGIKTRTADPVFDAYCQYTYMDNVLRGGYPIRLGKDKIFYVYSRKHGDLERDYNYFSMLPEPYSQGNGNFRDVNQNRRCDTFFAPFVGRENIHTFYSLIQLDGYNPLGVEKLTYTLEREKAEELLKDTKEEVRERLLPILTGAFTPGQLSKALSAPGSGEDEGLFEKLLEAAHGLVNGNFGEGYWSDHWTYNLDLIEEYLSLFPEREEEMLYEKSYSWFLSQININPRARRYEVTEKGVRQYHALNEASRRHTKDKLVREAFGKGDILLSTLMEKLILLCTVKFAALDPYGMGIEMEGGKPGWYDALNGLPGLLGSSMAETYELARMLEYTVGALERWPQRTELLTELAELLEQLHRINQAEAGAIRREKELLSFWNQTSDALEAYREKTYEGVSGERRAYEAAELAAILRGFWETAVCGIEKACGYGKGICPTYFTYEVEEYERNEEGIFPGKFAVQSVPYFLEGPVRYLKLPNRIEDKRALYRRVKSSDLYDQKLSMYKVNASLENASYELGRARAFTPGWLENESIWLHMEYKYLLELLRSGLYEEFIGDFHNACIPFLDESMYGRSVLENSSFLAGSKNPNEKIHGKGFVARLSGSTIEFISMWRRMLFGERPFFVEDGQLCAAFAPVLPEYLIGGEKRITARFLGQTDVTYTLTDEVRPPEGHELRGALGYTIEGKRNYVPGTYEIKGMRLTYRDGKCVTVCGGTLKGQAALDLRDGKVEKAEVTLI